VLEVIEQDLGGERQLRTKPWPSKAPLTRFTSTADNALAIGDEARHGQRRHDPPAKLMTLNEADALIRSLIGQWLERKITGSQ
jgi:hypothetical protein